MFYFYGFSIQKSFFGCLFKAHLRLISLYSVASTSEAAFVIGGWDRSSSLDVIVKFANDKWSLYGNLRKRRYGHGSITVGTDTLIIGGYTPDGS